MGLLDLFFGKDISRDWNKNSHETIVIDLDRATVCGIGEGQPIDVLAHLGPARDQQQAKQGVLIYDDRGLRLIHHKGSLTGCELFFDREDYTPFAGDFVVGGRTLKLSSDTTCEETTRLLGQPDEQEDDEEDGIRYSYAPSDAICMEFLFNPAGRLTAIELI